VRDLAPSEVDVLIGSRDLDSSEAIRLPVLDIIVYPEYDPYLEDGDLALLLLPASAELQAAAIEPIQIVPDGTFEAPGVMARVLGWGVLGSTGESPTLLQKVTLPIVANDVAEPFYGVVTENMLFAGYDSAGINTCSGDSGGPLLVPDDEDDYYLAGITSFGRGDVDCEAAENYGGYTRLSAYKDWLARMIRPHQTAWEAEHGLPADESDFDGDGLSGFAEFAFRKHPRIPDAMEPKFQFSDGSDGRSTNLLFTTFALSPEIDFKVEGSTALANGTFEAIPFSTIKHPYPMDPTEKPFTATAMVDLSPYLESDAPRFFRFTAHPTNRLSPARQELRFGGFAFKTRKPILVPPSETSAARFVAYGDATTGGDWNLAIRANDFTPLVDLPKETLQRSNDRAKIYRLSLAPDEALRFSVDAGIGDGGDYRLALFRDFPPATALSTGNTLEGNLSTSDLIYEATYDYTLYQDLYSLGQWTPGTFVTIAMSSTKVDPYLELVDMETGLVLAENDDGFSSGNNAYLDFIVPDGDALEYVYLRATSYDQLDTGSYDLAVGNGRTLGVDGPTINASLTTSDPLDPIYTEAEYYRDDYLLTGYTAGQSVTITMSGSDLDAVLYIVDGNTDKVVEYTDNTFKGKRETLRFEPEAGHSYRVRATSWGERETGGYTIRAY